MQIEKIYVENFRSIKKGEVSLGGITTFLGRNGVGKSTVLYALESFYNVAVQYSHLDYYNHQQADTTIRIRVTYSALRPDELAAFGSYVQDGRLTVTKVINQGGARYFGTVPQIVAFSELRKLSANDKRNGLKQKVDAGEFPDFGEIPRRSEEVDQAMDAYEAKHPELTQPIERETQFLGPRNVGGGKLDKFTKFVLVPAVRDAAAEMEKRGAIAQLLELIVARSINNRRDFQEFKQEFEAKARALYGKENLPELAELGKMVTEKLERYAPGSELSIDFEELVPPSIPLPDAVVSVSEDNFKVPIRYTGHGLQRALILALLEQLSMMPSRQPADSDKSEEKPVEATRLPDLILAIEEPELYLHPARSRYLARILRELAMKDSNADLPKTQIVCVTHSPYFVNVEHFDEVRMCRKEPPAEAGHPRITVFTTFTRAEAAARLAQITHLPPEQFTAATFVARASPVLNSLVNEGLFADVALVVEGDSDVSAVWAMQMFMGKKWDELGIVVVPVMGKNNIDRAVVAFQGFGIPTYFLFDGDKSKGEGAATNRTLLRLGNADVVDFPPTRVDAGCAFFEDDIETYLRAVLEGRFETLREECSTRCGHEKPGTALKNSEVMSLFLHQAHKEGIEFPVLQDIVQRVSEIALALRAA